MHIRRSFILININNMFQFYEVKCFSTNSRIIKNDKVIYHYILCTFYYDINPWELQFQFHCFYKRRPSKHFASASLVGWCFNPLKHIDWIHLIVYQTQMQWFEVEMRFIVTYSTRHLLFLLNTVIPDRGTSISPDL